MPMKQFMTITVAIDDEKQAISSMIEIEPGAWNPGAVIAVAGRLTLIAARLAQGPDEYERLMNADRNLRYAGPPQPTDSEH